MKTAAALAALLILAAAAEAQMLVWPDGVARAAAPARLDLPDGGTIIRPTAEQAIASGLGYRFETAEEAEAREAAAEAARIEREAQAAGEKVAQFGQMVAVLRANLVAVGHDIPVSSTAVTVDLMGRAAARVLSPQERAAKDDIFQLYILLKEAGITDSDIAAIWSAIQPGE
jgi:hypothetical protein